MSQPKFSVPELSEPYCMPFDHGSITADGTIRLDKVPAGKKLRIDSVQYTNPTGLVGDTANAFALFLKKNVGGSPATIATLFNTDTDDVPAGASLAADTWVTATLSATDSDLVLDGGDTLDLVPDEDGTATLPAGHGVVRGHYV